MGKFLHSFFSPLGFRHAVPQVWDGFQTNIRLMVIAELLVLVFALGLAIVRAMLDAHCGAIRLLESEQGTAFELTIPLADQPLPC